MASTKDLVLRLCRLEGKKKQVNVAQMTEIVGRIADVLYTEDQCLEVDTWVALVQLGRRRYLASRQKRCGRRG